jgi:ketohexokinase
MQGVRIVATGRTPTSYITLNQRNGSRTIVHYRDLLEYSLTDFQTLPLEQAGWLHFEGRNVIEVRAMIDAAKQHYPDLRISVEIEKPRPDIETLWHGADVLLFSRHYALAMGYNSATALLQSVQAKLADSPRLPLLVCTWGDQGAYAMDKTQLLHSPALPVAQMVDSIGAGDTFNAGFIHASLQSADCASALEYAVRLASKKCGQYGFDGLV